MSRVRPILFNGEMVQAILREEPYNKTATRRKIKGFIPDDAVFGYTAFTPKGYISCRGTFDNGYGEKFFKLLCQSGDILYVRETWFYEMHLHDKVPGKPDLPSGRYLHRYVYKADSPDYPVGIGVGANGWRPSIHMPKEAARIWLKVTDVRVERLQDITIGGCQEEGCWCGHNGDIFAFMALWDSTIKKPGIAQYGWNANPWVWVIGFERCERPKGWPG